MKGNNRTTLYSIKLFYEINFDYTWEKNNIELCYYSASLYHGNTFHLTLNNYVI